VNRVGARSSSRRARAAEQHWRETSRRAGVGLTLAAIALPVVTVGAVVALGVGLGPHSADGGAASASASPRATADLTARPAQVVVDSLLSAAPPGWTPYGAVVRSASDPLVEGCDATVPAGTTTATRRFDVAGRGIAVTVTAYSAGAGPVAVRDRVAALASCPDVTAGASSTLAGVDAYVAYRTSSTLPAVSVLGWRRGDVVVAVYAPGRNPVGLADRARVLDGRLLVALQGRCAEVASALADAARSPYVEGVEFTGRLVPVPVAVDPLPTAVDASPLPTRVPVAVDPVPTAVDTSPLPTLVPAPTISFPVRPLDPVWPTDLPSPVAVPSLPADPGPEPTATAIPSRAPDPVGPGCGWAFTGVTAPEFSSADEAARVESLVSGAREQLVAGQEEWRLRMEAYRGEAAAYDEQLAAFLQYAEQVRVVAAAWDLITAGRDAYAQDLAAYEAAVSAAQQFTVDQENARLAYEAAVHACSAADPTDVASPTDSPTPTGTDLPTPTPSPTTPPSATPTTAGCPPDVPPILFEQPPVLPPSPTPPPDPTPPTTP
jgi:hypothetical protein